MTASRRFGAISFGKQTGVVANGGTAATAPLFQCPILSGSLSPQKDWGDLPRIGSSLARLGKFAQRARGGGSVTMLAHPEALGLLLYEVMGVQAVTGAGPYIHRFTMQDEYPADPLTCWSNVGVTGATGSVWKFTDTFVQSLSIEGSSGENLVVTCDFLAFDYAPLTALPATSGTGNSVEDESPRLKYIGSVVELDADGTTLAEFKNIENVTFQIDRAPEVRYGASLTPTIISPDRMLNFSLGMTYDSAMGGWDFLMTTMTGSPGGSGPNQGTPTGSFDVKFGRHPADAAKYLRIVSGGDTAADPTAQATWQYELAVPDASAEPTILDFDIAGMVARPTTGTSEVQVLLANDFVSTY